MRPRESFISVWGKKKEQTGIGEMWEVPPLKQQPFPQNLGKKYAHSRGAGNERFAEVQHPKSTKKPGCPRGGMQKSEKGFRT